MSGDVGSRAARWAVLLAPFAVYLAALWQAVTSWQVFTALDFRAYYTAGLMLRSGVRGDFYDLAVQFDYQRAWATGLQDMTYLMPFPYPAVLALPLAVVAVLPPVHAYLAWAAANLGLLVLVLRQLSQALTPLPPTIRLRGMVLFLTLLPVVITLVQGQVSLLLLLGYWLAWRAFRERRDFQAGLLLSMVALRPQLLLLPGLLLVAKARWQAVLGLALGTGVLVLASLLLVGVDGLVGNLRLWLTSASGGEQLTVHPQSMYTWRSQVQLLLGTDAPAPALGPWMVGVLVCVIVMGMAWRGAWRSGDADFDLRWAALVAAALFTSPHANLHDVVLLALSGALIARWHYGQQGGWAPWLIGLGYLATQVGPLLAPYTRIQPVVWVMAAIVALAAWGRRRQAFSSGA